MNAGKPLQINRPLRRDAVDDPLPDSFGSDAKLTRHRPSTARLFDCFFDV